MRSASNETISLRVSSAIFILKESNLTILVRNIWTVLVYNWSIFNAPSSSGVLALAVVKILGRYCLASAARSLFGMIKIITFIILARCTSLTSSWLTKDAILLNTSPPYNRAVLMHSASPPCKSNRHSVTLSRQLTWSLIWSFDCFAWNKPSKKAEIIFRVSPRWRSRSRTKSMRRHSLWK